MWQSHICNFLHLSVHYSEFKVKFKKKLCRFILWGNTVSHCSNSITEILLLYVMGNLFDIRKLYSNLFSTFM